MYFSESKAVLITFFQHKSIEMNQHVEEEKIICNKIVLSAHGNSKSSYTIETDIKPKSNPSWDFNFNSLTS
ncbi:hypothetical protein A9996_18420 [Gelidibacter algens]|nr:hypothetical protein A9996_18420 [Gelidibacter algens]